MTVKILKASEDIRGFELQTSNTYQTYTKDDCTEKDPDVDDKKISRKRKRVKLTIETKGKRNKEIKAEVTVLVSKAQLRNVLLKQALSEERSVLKLGGVAVYYADLLDEISPNVNTACEVNCPFCEQCTVDRMLLTHKLKKDTEFLVNYVLSSTQKAQKDKYMTSLDVHYQNQPDGAKHHLETEHLRTSDALVRKLTTWLNLTGSSDNMFLKQAVPASLLNSSEVLLGKREALRLLKVQLLKTRKCGICEESFSSDFSKVARVLSKIDQSLTKLS